MPARRCTPLGPSPPFQTLAEEARSTYTDVRENVYRFGAKGTVANETSFPCDCVAGPDGDNCDERCFNRQLYIECVECPCGSSCQNRRFQRKEWAKVNVVKTKEKGFGLTAVEDMKSGQLVMEYVGEVLPREQFLQRVVQYSEHGLKHFYFMELKKDEVIDATQRGCLARFINHSCAPNCTLQKWVVGNQSRMGIFTSKNVARGQELTFDYKFERYGAKAQICYCGEDACTGYIGGEKGEKREVDKIDEELEADTENNDPRVPIISNGLEFDEIPKCVQLMHRTQQRPQWALVLLRSLNLTSCPRALNHFRQLKGLPLLNSWLKMYKDDITVVKRILEFIPNIHIVDRRTVQDENNVENTGIEFGVEKFINHEDAEIVQQAKKILETWGQLERSTKIPKKRKSISSADDNESKRQRQLPPWAIEAQQARERQIKEEEERRLEIRTANAEAARIMAERIATANAERRRREREEREAEIEANRLRIEEAKRLEEERRMRIEEETRRLAEERRVEEEEKKRAEKERDSAAELEVSARKHQKTQKTQHHHNHHIGHGHSKTNGKHRHHHSQKQEKANGHSSKHSQSQKHPTHNGGHGEAPSHSHHEKSSHAKPWSEKIITIDGKDGVKLRRVIAEAVTKHMSKYTKEFQSTERFKRHAGDVTQILVDKELKKEQERIEMNEQKWNKIRLFVKDYAEKVVSRLHVKEGSEKVA